ncbi:hypothetical protein ACHHYP_13735 [Achlya hypogyna]|uniref:Uncharacterized protein n=1 Tax=Achlya hypogyna TaxID=1202772 RepID=A0A1V9YER9_ACHHY|nr:hypothetical protein ACHHYP_13735 [Achlya hypogyna]
MRLTTGHIQALATIYSDAFDVVLKLMSADATNGVVLEKDSIKYSVLLEDKVGGDVAALESRVASDLEHETFGQWKDEVLRLWHEKKRRQAAHSERLVQDKADHLFHFEEHAKVYKQKLLNLLALKGANFNEVFAAVLEQAGRDHPPPANSVHRDIDRVFNESNIFTKDQLVALRDRKPESTTWLTRAMDKVAWPNTSSKEEVREAVRDFVRAELADVRRYREDIVLQIMVKTKQQKMVKETLSRSLMNVAVATLYDEITTGLVNIQTRWDDANSVVAKLEACKPSMCRFAKSVREGRKAADLLTATLDQWIQDDLHKAIVEEVVAQVALRLKNQRWVHNAEAMQGVLDKALLVHVQTGATDQVLRALQLPEEHTTMVVRRLTLATVQECYGDTTDFVFDCVRDSVIAAAAAAANADSRRSECFLLKLRLELQARLKRSGTSALVEGLPKTTHGLLACDEQGPDIFKVGHAQSVLTKVLRSLDTHKIALDESSVITSSIANDVVDLIRDEAYGAASGIVPRCGKPCPFCSCPCTKALGHASTTGDGPHDTFHQPAGLVGCHDKVSRRLTCGSCATLVADDAYMICPDGASRPFRSFCEVYPAWALPTVTQPLPLREYIFAKYQTELSQHYYLLKCEIIPSSYLHDIDDLERQIDRLIT